MSEVETTKPGCMSPQYWRSNEKRAPILRRKELQYNETRLHVSAVLELFSHWISHSREAGQVAGQHSSAHVELSRAMATGDLRNKLHALRAKVRQLEDDSELLQRLNDIEEKATFLVSI